MTTIQNHKHQAPVNSNGCLESVADIAERVFPEEVQEIREHTAQHIDAGRKIGPTDWGSVLIWFGAMAAGLLLWVVYGFFPIIINTLVSVLGSTGTDAVKSFTRRVSLSISEAFPGLSGMIALTIIITCSVGLIVIAFLPDRAFGKDE